MFNFKRMRVKGLIIIGLFLVALTVSACLDGEGDATPPVLSETSLGGEVIDFWTEEIILEFEVDIEGIEIAGIDDYRKEIVGNMVILFDLNLELDRDYEINYIAVNTGGEEVRSSISFRTSGKNDTMMQTFYWFMGEDIETYDSPYHQGPNSDYGMEYPEEKDLWNLLAHRAERLADKGITSMWLPPANKAEEGISDVGYATYDLWDLGEFDQRGSVRTKYGSKAELKRAIDRLDSAGIDLYYDVVINHRMAGDLEEVPLNSTYHSGESQQPEGAVDLISNYTWRFTLDPSEFDQLDADDINEVHIVGSFQGWTPDDKSYSLSEENGVWIGEFEVDEGEEFKFMYDTDTWDAGQHVGIEGDPHSDNFKVENIDSTEEEVVTNTLTAHSDFSGLKGRDKYYSQADEWKWNWKAFNGTDYFVETGVVGPTLFEGKSWDDAYDRPFLMGLDVDFQNHKVQDEIKEWGRWLINDIGFNGFRLDAIKHVDTPYVREWLAHVQDNTEEDVFYVAEAWINDTFTLSNYLDTVGNSDLTAFDFPLKSALDLMSSGHFNMRSLATAGLVNYSGYEDRAVTFTDNHDTHRDNERAGITNYNYQAYLYILTREGGLPTIFWKDYYQHGMGEGLSKLLEVRRDFAYGRGYEVDNNDIDTYSYVREGAKQIDGSGLVMMITIDDSGDLITKEIDSRQANTQFYDYTGNVEGIVETDAKGYGDFKVRGSESDGWSVWVSVQ